MLVFQWYVRISGFRAGCLDALALPVCGGIEYLLFLQELCNLHRASPFHAQHENTLDGQRCRFTHDPLCLVLRVFAVAERNIGGQVNAAFTLCLIDSTNFAAGVLGKKFVKPVLDTRNVAVGTVGIDGVKVIVDGNITHIVLRASVYDSPQPLLLLTAFRHSP